MNAVEDIHVTPTKELLLDDSESFANNLKGQKVKEESCFDGGTLKVLCDSTSDLGHGNQTTPSRQNGVKNGPSEPSHWVEHVNNDDSNEHNVTESESKESNCCIGEVTPKQVHENDEESDAHNIFDRGKEDCNSVNCNNSFEPIKNNVSEDSGTNDRELPINEQEKMEESKSSRMDSDEGVEEAELDVTLEKENCVDEENLKNNVGDKDCFLTDSSTRDDNCSMADMDENSYSEGHNNGDCTEIEERKSEECNDIDMAQGKNEAANLNSPLSAEPNSTENGELEPMDTHDQYDNDDLPEDALTIDTGRWSAEEDDEKSKHVSGQTPSNVQSDDDEKSKSFTEQASSVPSDDDEKSKSFTEQNALNVQSDNDEKSKSFTEQASSVPSDDDEKSKSFTEQNALNVQSDNDEKSKSFAEQNAFSVQSEDDEKSKSFTEQNSFNIPSDDEGKNKSFTEQNALNVQSDDDEKSKSFTEQNASSVQSEDDEKSKSFTEQTAFNIQSDDENKSFAEQNSTALMEIDEKPMASHIQLNEDDKSNNFAKQSSYFKLDHDKNKHFMDENESQIPSDDDVDPDALMIDTAMDEENVIENKEVNEETNNIEKVPGQELKLTISLNKARMGVLKKAKKNINRIGRNSNKNVKKRVRIPGDALKCPRCPLTSFLTVNSLIEHQEKCRAFSTAPVVQQSDIPKVPRKVYMCSACGSYLENWNLFLHMKEMHKRNICLHCLGMFSQASKLIQHLATKHGVIDQVLEYGDQLAEKFPGPQFLLCSRCDQMCTDKNFESHSCSSVCSHCGLTGTHYPTCRLAPPPSMKPIKTPKRRARATKKPRKQITSSMIPPSILTTPSEEPVPPEAPSPADDLSPTTYNERMLQLYRIKPLEHRSFSTLESIEETINRVVEEGLSPKQETFKNEENTVYESNEKTSDVNNEVMEQDNEEPEDEVEEKPVPISQPPTQYIPHLMPEIKSDTDSSDSEKLTINLEPKRRQRVKYSEKVERQKMEVLNRSEPPPPVQEEVDGVVLAGEDTPFTCVPLPEPLDSARVPIAMKLFLRATALLCVYCAHARKIAVNAKQLALHQLAQHRYITVADSTPAVDKLLNHTSVVEAMRDALPALENVYFNAYGFDSSDRTAWRSADRVYECFHCSFITQDLREFTTHNKKLHSNDLSENHLCIMCKTRFITYSELLCHLCCGVYVPGRIIDPYCRYRCYCCDIEPLPSSFRLMVHLRQTHTACDMCFTLCDSQAALSSHILKHKSLFYCYACAITYGNQPELSKHIFWKHGAESVTCKRCLQKKWRHAYHFCLPAASFPCDTCGSLFKSTSMVRVHSRLHSGEYPHACGECSEKFISKKLLEKHVLTHTQTVEPAVNGTTHTEETENDENKKKSKKDIRDFFDLPPVNLSESDDSSGDEQTEKKIEVKPGNVEASDKNTPPEPLSVAGPSSEATPAPATLWDGVLASLEEKCKGISYAPDSPFYNLPLHRVLAIALNEHDYCGTHSTVKEDSQVGREHDYCNNGNSIKPTSSKHSPKKMNKRRTRSSSSDSSSSSSSGSTCPSNCSCCSTTSSTESASSGEHKMPRKTKADLKAGKKKKVAVVKKQPEPEPKIEVCDIRIQESDLETDEPVTDDEEFYELNPALRANEALLQKRSILVDKLEIPSQSKPHTPQTKLKIKKKRAGMMKSRGSMVKLGSPQGYSSPYPSLTHADDSSNTSEGDGKRPRRKRVPLKFYGFSSGEEDEMMSQPSRKKERLLDINTTIAASPPHAAVPSPQPEPSSNLWNPPSWRPPPVPPRVNPIKIRTGSLKQTFAKSNNSDEFHIKRAELGGFQVNGGPNSADNGQPSEKLYCFCQCPYDEVSEMIACDAHDCLIEWFHFECVGIMDPPKGKWYCPDCKKKAAAESEMMSFIR